MGYSLNINFFLKIIIIKAGNVEKANWVINLQFGENSRPNCTPLCQKMIKKNTNSMLN